MGKNNKDIKNMVEWIYTIDPFVECPIMLLNGEIGFDISGQQFAKELYTLDSMGKQDIKIMINSIGGSVIDGMSIYDAIMETEANVITYNVGVALSISAVIFLSGDYRCMRDYARLMYHNPYNEDGSQDEGLEEIRESLITMIAAKTGVSVNLIEEMLNKETWINAEEAKNIGFTDEIKETQLATKQKIEKQDGILNTWKYANIIMNKFIHEETNKKTQEMRTKKYIKNTDMPSEDVLDKVEEVLNSDATDELDDLEDQKEEITEEIAEVKEEIAGDDDDDETLDSAEEIMDLKNKLAACMNELENMKNLVAKSESEALDAKISNMLNGFVKAGKIKGDNDSMADWVASAKNNFEFTERLINNLPVTKEAVKFDIKKPLVSMTGTDYVAVRMAELRSKQVK